MVLLNRRRAGCLVIVCVAALSSPAVAQPGLPRAAPSEPPDQHSLGVMIGGALGLGSESTIVLDGWFGAAIHPHLALFGEVMGFATAEAGLGFLGGGVRLSYARVFLNARLGRASQSYSCDFDDPCTSAAAVAGVIGIGLEPLHSTHAGLEIRLDVFRAFQDTLIAVGVGGSFYLL